MSRLASPARVALQRSIEHGVTGTYQTLADLVGVEPERARATLKELSRCGKVGVSCRQRTAGSAGASPGVYAAAARPFDALGFALQVWR